MDEILREELLREETGMRKFSTNIDGVFVYELLSGFNWQGLILRNQSDIGSDIFGERSIFVEYGNIEDGEFVDEIGVEYNGLDTEFVLG